MSGSSPFRSTSGAARGRRIVHLTYSKSNWFNQRNIGNAQSFGEQRSARASNLAPSLGPAGTFRRAAQREGVEPTAWHACRRYT